MGTVGDWFVPFRGNDPAMEHNWTSLEQYLETLSQIQGVNILGRRDCAADPLPPDVPEGSNKQGDAYVCDPENHLWVWDGTQWIDTGPWTTDKHDFLIDVTPNQHHSQQHLLYGADHTDVDSVPLAIRDVLARPDGTAHWTPETRLNWRRGWLSTGTYHKDDVVVDGDWTMVANKTTTEQPSPQPTGDPQLPLDGAVWTEQGERNDIIFGNDFTFATPGWVTEIVIDVHPENVEKVHTLMITLDGIDSAPVTFVPPTSGIRTLTISPKIVAIGSVLEVLIRVQEPGNDFVFWWESPGFWATLPPYLSGAEGYLDSDEAGNPGPSDAAYRVEIKWTEVLFADDWDVLASSSGGSTGSGAGFSGLHDDLTDVTPDQHHTKYTDAEATAAVGPHTPTFVPSGLHADLTDVTTDQHHPQLHSLDSHTDVSAPTPVDGYRLAWDEAQAAWIPKLSRSALGIVTFDYRIVNATPTPASGRLAGDIDDPPNVTTVYINKFDDNGEDISLFLENIIEGVWLNVHESNDVNNHRSFDATGPSVLVGDVYEVPVTFFDQAGTPLTNNQQVNLFLRFVQPDGFDGAHSSLSNVLPDQHHARYTDSEAVAAVGPHTPEFVPSNLHTDLTDVSASQHHSRYTDAEAVAAVGDPGAGVYLPLSGGTLTGVLTTQSVIRAIDGGLGAPPYSFTSSPTSGMYLAAGGVRIGHEGAFAAQFSAGQVLASTGTGSLPSLSFQARSGIGIYSPSTDQVAVALGSNRRRLLLDPSFAQFSYDGSYSAYIKMAPGSAATPTYAFDSDTNTGMFRVSSDVLGFATAGLERVRLTGNDVFMNGGTTAYIGQGNQRGLFFVSPQASGSPRLVVQPDFLHTNTGVQAVRNTIIGTAAPAGGYGVDGDVYLRYT